MKFFTQLFLRLWASALWYARMDFKKPSVRCDTCPRWKYHATVRPRFIEERDPAAGEREFPPVPLGVCALSRPAIVNQGGIGFGLRLFHPDDWCPNHPFYKSAPASDLPKFMPELHDGERNADGTEGQNAGFDRAPTFEEAMRLAKILQNPGEQSGTICGNCGINCRSAVDVGIAVMRCKEGLACPLVDWKSPDQ